MAAQHGQLVAENGDLGVFGHSVHPVDAVELQGAPGEAVEETTGLRPAAWPGASSLVNSGG